MHTFSLLITFILILQTFVQSNDNLLVRCDHCFQLSNYENSSSIEVKRCGNEDCVAMVVNSQQTIMETKLDFNFEHCGKTKPCKQKQETNKLLIRRGEFPWMVRLEIRLFSIDIFRNLCSGTLIHPQWILTAAHCMLDTLRKTLIPADDLIIYIGKRAWKMTNNTEKWSVNSSLYIIHPKFHMSQSVASINDLALIKLTKPVEINNDVNIICLPDQSSSLKDGTEGFVGIWNNASANIFKIKQARKARLRLTDTETCRRLSSLDSIDEVLHICAHNDHGDNICPGDSGSGLWVRGRKANATTKQWYIFGVASYGKMICSRDINHDNAFATVSIHTNWIRNMIEQY